MNKTWVMLQKKILLTGCLKLILTEPYNGKEYSIVLKSRASSTDLYSIISRVETEKLNDESLSISYHYATRSGKVITMIVTMNKKALELVSQYYTFKYSRKIYPCSCLVLTQICKEPKVKAIKPEYDTPVNN